MKPNLQSAARVTVALLGASLVAALVACYRGPGTENPIETEGAPVLPWGVVATQAERKRQNMGGIYPASRHDLCCAVDKNATVQVLAPARPRHLYLEIYFPDFGTTYGLLPQPQVVTVGFGPYRESQRVTGSGIRELTFKIPKDVPVVDGRIRFAMRMSYAVVPSEVSDSLDSRRFSVILRGVDVD